MGQQTSRVPVIALAVAGFVLSAPAGCTNGGDEEPAAGTPLGCGMVEARDLVGLLGADATSEQTGTLAVLRERHRPASCRSVSADDPRRSVTVRAVHHPDPMPLPRGACNEGWVYAGSPDKYAPACQTTHDGRSRTVLLARWDEYVVQVTVTRPDRAWGGDPELALRMTEQVATRLGVDVPSPSH